MLILLQRSLSYFYSLCYRHHNQFHRTKGCIIRKEIFVCFLQFISYFHYYTSARSSICTRISKQQESRLYTLRRLVLTSFKLILQHNNSAEFRKFRKRSQAIGLYCQDTVDTLVLASHKVRLCLFIGEIFPKWSK